MNRLIRRVLLFLSVLALISPVLLPAVSAEESVETEEEIILDPEPEEETAEEAAVPSDPTARDAFIDDIIALGKKLFNKARGKPSGPIIKATSTSARTSRSTCSARTATNTAWRNTRTFPL